MQFGLSGRAKRKLPDCFGCPALDPEQPSDSRPSFGLLGRLRPCRGEDLFYDLDRLSPRGGIRGQHCRERSERGLLVDQQHQELLPHQRLELREGDSRQLPLRLANATHQFEAAFVNRPPGHANVKDRPDDALAQTADRNAGFQFRDTVAQQFFMERVFPRLSQRVRRGRIDTASGLQRG